MMACDPVGVASIADRKSIDRGMVVTDLRLLRKSGGKSGDYEAIL